MSAQENPRQPLIFIESDSVLAQICETWLADAEKYGLLAIDSEFMRTRTYYPLPALLQVNDGVNNYIIDIVTLKDLEPLRAVLESKSIIKALHAGSEDIEVLYGLFETIPCSLVDTQIAAALLGYGFSMGYGNLVCKLFEVELPKGETRSDWLHRPLSESQKGYAALDVEYLYPLAKRLIQELHDKQRYPWLEQEVESLCANFKNGLREDIGFKKFKSAWKYKPQELEIIKRLYIWRELEARQRDLPKNHIVRDVMFSALALSQPKHLSQLHSIDNLSPRAIRQYGKEIIHVVEQALACESNNLPVRPERPLSSAQKKVVAEFKQQFLNLAQDLGIAPEIFVRRSDLEALVRLTQDASLTQEFIQSVFDGWRLDVIEQTLYGAE